MKNFWVVGMNPNTDCLLINLEILRVGYLKLIRLMINYIKTYIFSVTNIYLLYLQLPLHCFRWFFFRFNGRRSFSGVMCYTATEPEQIPIHREFTMGGVPFCEFCQVFIYFFYVLPFPFFPSSDSFARENK